MNKQLLPSCAALLLWTSPFAAADAFNWIDGASGNFSDPGRWRDVQNQTFDPPNPNPFGRYPSPNDIVAFPQDQGPYTVTIDNGSVRGTSIADTFAGSVITLSVAGTYQAGETYVIDTIFTGGGIVRGAPVLVYDTVLSGVQAEFSNLRIGSSSPLAVGGLVIQNNAALTSGGSLVMDGMATLNAGAWTHTGIVPLSQIDMLNGSRLTVREVNAADPPSRPNLLVTGGSRVDMDNIQARVDAFGASLVTFKRAELFSEPAFLQPAVFSDVGTTLTVTEQLHVTGGPLQFRDGARLLTPQLSHEQGAFSTEAIGSGSAITVSGLLDSGAAAALDGAFATVATAENAALNADGEGSVFHFNTLTGDSGFNVTAGGVLTGGSITLTSGGGNVRGAGSHLDLTGNLEVGIEAFARIVADEAGRIDCAQAAIGDGAGGNGDFTVTGTNTFMLARNGMIVGGDLGALGNLSVLMGGRVQVGLQNTRGASAEFGLARNGDGRLTVQSGGVFDARFADEMTVGVEAKGRVTTTSRGRTLARNLTAGLKNGSDGLLVCSLTNSSIEVQETLLVGDRGRGTLDVVNGSTVAAQEIRAGNADLDNQILVRLGGTLRFSDGLSIGNAGRATLRVTGGGQVLTTTNGTRLGLGEVTTNAAGTLIIDGTNSAVLLTNGVMVVGTEGNGMLTVSNNGTLYLSIATIGGADGSTGAATVAGLGSQWTLSTSLDVGGFAQAVPGSLTVSDSGFVRIGRFMGVTSAGVVTLNGGRIVVGAGDPPPGVLRVGAGGTLKLGGRFTGGKIIHGLGGRILPGNSPGTAQIEGDFEQEAGALLEMEIAGTTAGSLHDQILVTGTTTLNGTLEARFTNGFAPVQGQTFDLIDAASVAGAFANVVITGLQPGFQHEERTTGDGRVQLVALNNGIAVTQPAEPRLSIERVQGLVVVSYPPELQGWTLQASPDLASGSWNALAAPDHVLTLTPDNAHRFFRLVQP